MAADSRVQSELKGPAAAEAAMLHTPPSADDHLPAENADEREDVLWEGPY